MVERVKNIMGEPKDNVLIELKNVKKAANYYIKGVIDRNFEYLCKGWHKDCEMIGLNDEGEAVRSPRIWWKDVLAQPIIDQNFTRQSEILSIDIVGMTAIVKIQTIVTSTNNTILFTDFLSLLKIKNEWQIVSKIYNKEIIQ